MVGYDAHALCFSLLHNMPMPRSKYEKGSRFLGMPPRNARDRLGHTPLQRQQDFRQSDLRDADDQRASANLKTLPTDGEVSHVNISLLVPLLESSVTVRLVRSTRATSSSTTVPARRSPSRHSRQNLVPRSRRTSRRRLGF